MNASDLDRLEMLDRTATAGPWYSRHFDDEHSMSAVAITITPPVDDDRGISRRSDTWPHEEVVAVTLLQQPQYALLADDRWDENAALIVEMRNVLPELLRLARIGLVTEIAGRS